RISTIPTHLCCVYLYVIHPAPPPFPYTTLFRSGRLGQAQLPAAAPKHPHHPALEQALVLAGADRRQQHQHARRQREPEHRLHHQDRKSTRLNSSHVKISYAVFCLKKKKDKNIIE